MANFNKVILMGNLTRDVEMRTTQGGMAVAKLGMAINRKWTQNGEQKESTCFVDLTAFGRQAEVLSQYVAKGSPLFVEGRLEYSTWEAKDGGGKRSKLEVVIDNFQFVGAPRGAAGGGAPAGGGEDAGARRPAAKKPGQAEGGGEVDYGDIPF
jgi:single-strand DNA-binding protein